MGSPVKTGISDGRRGEGESKKSDHDESALIARTSPTIIPDTESFPRALTLPALVPGVVDRADDEERDEDGDDGFHPASAGLGLTKRLNGPRCGSAAIAG
jgi:hypothetical protein